MELRNDDVAIIKDLVERNGLFYLTVDVEQLIEEEDEGVVVKNENPKLRTFLIAPDTQWTLCHPVSIQIKVSDIIKKREWFIDSFINYSAKGGRIIESSHFSCAG